MHEQNIAREFMPFLAPWTKPVMYLLVSIAILFFLRGTGTRLKQCGLDWKSFSLQFFQLLRKQSKERFFVLVKYGLAQLKLLRFPTAGAFHWLIYSGMLLLLTGTILLFFQESVFQLFQIDYFFLQGKFYLAFEIILDTAGVFLVLGVIIAILRRTVLKPAYLPGSAEIMAILVLLLFVGVSGFFLEGLRLYLRSGSWGAYSYVGNMVYHFISVSGVNEVNLFNLYPFFWWGHVILAFSLVVLLPYTRLFHLIVIPLNIVIAADGREKPKLTTPFYIRELSESEFEEIKIGLGSPVDLDWKQKFALIACTNCGRCEYVCPGNNAGREISPRQIIQNLLFMCVQFEQNQRKKAKDKTGSPLPGEEKSYLFSQGFIGETTVWSCTNCAACMEECPTLIKHIDYVLDMRRQLLSEGNINEQIAALLTGLDRNSNPYGLPSYERYEWLADLGVPNLKNNPDAEIIYWVGCAGSYDSRAKEIVVKIIQLFNYLGINYAVLGEEERCCGEPAKRVGEEGLFQVIALQNVETLQQYAKKIVTHCPHCYNMLKHEYRDFGLELDVIHHTNFLLDVLGNKDIGTKYKNSDQGGPGVTYHDPCNLGRLNGIYAAPRRLIEDFCGYRLIEPPRNRDRGFCCGGGGANAWYSVPEREKISLLRVKEIVSVLGNGLLAVACPFCAGMLEDAAKIAGVEENIQIKDVAEILAEKILAVAETSEKHKPEEEKL